MPAPTEPDLATAEDDATVSSRRKVARVAIGLTIAALVVLWVYAFSGLARRDPPNQLDDPAFGAEAQEICGATVTRVDALPPAQDARSGAERADSLDLSNVYYLEMVEALRAVAPASGRDGEMANEWIDDWETYVGDRQTLADDFREDPAARLHVTAKGGDQITDAIDNLAEVNEMPACVTPGDVN